MNKSPCKVVTGHRARPILVKPNKDMQVLAIQGILVMCALLSGIIVTVLVMSFV